MADNPLGIVCRLNERHPLVTQLKRRFGFHEVNDLFTLAFEQRIRGVQMMNSLQTHGQLDKATLKALGVHVDGESHSL